MGSIYASTCCDLFGALKQRRVTDQAIVREALVAGAGNAAEVVFVIEIHIDRADLQYGTRNPGSKARPLIRWSVPADQLVALRA